MALAAASASAMRGQRLAQRLFPSRKRGWLVLCTFSTAFNRPLCRTSDIWHITKARLFELLMFKISS